MANAFHKLFRSVFFEHAVLKVNILERRLTYIAGVRYSTAGSSTEAFTIAQQEFSRAQSPAEKMRWLEAMSSSGSIKALITVLDMLSAKTIIHNLDEIIPTVLSYIARHPEGHDLVWSFLQSEWSRLMARYGGSGSRDGYQFRALVEVAHSVTSSTQQRNKLKRMLLEQDLTFARLEERRQMGEAWRQRHQHDVCSWLSTHV